MSEARNLLHKLVRQLSQESPHHAVTIADQILADRPELVAAFFQEERVPLFHSWVSDVLRVGPGRSRHRSLSVETIYDLSFVIDLDSNRKTLGDMSGPDHFFVADDYDRQARQLKDLSELHRRIGREVGNKKTREVYDMQALSDLMKGT